MPKPVYKLKTLKDFKLFSLSQKEIERLVQDALTELSLRLSIECKDFDKGSIIRGQEVAKRALVVAAAGKHSILFVGPPGCGKTLLRSLGYNLSVYRCYEVWTCPCGNKDSPTHSCNCSSLSVDSHWKTFPRTDIISVISPVPERDMVSNLLGTSLSEMKEQVFDAGPKLANNQLCSECKMILKAAIAEIGFSGHDRTSIISVATTIARLDRHSELRPSYIVEAINYITPRYFKS